MGQGGGGAGAGQAGKKGERDTSKPHTNNTGRAGRGARSSENETKGSEETVRKQQRAFLFFFCFLFLFLFFLFFLFLLSLGFCFSPAWGLGPRAQHTPHTPHPTPTGRPGGSRAASHTSHHHTNDQGKRPRRIKARPGSTRSYLLFLLCGARLLFGHLRSPVCLRLGWSGLNSIDSGHCAACSDRFAPPKRTSGANGRRASESPRR